MARLPQTRKINTQAAARAEAFARKPRRLSYYSTAYSRLASNPSWQMSTCGLPPGMMLVGDRGPVYPVIMPPQQHNAAYYGGMPMPPMGYYGYLPGGVGYSYSTAMPTTTMPTTNLSAFPMAVPQIQTTSIPLAAPHRGVKRSAEPLTCSRESNAPRRKLMRVKHLCDEEWAASLQHASGSVFERLVVREAKNVERSTAIMARIRKGVSEDDKTTHPCFIVSRADSKRSSPFQIQVAKARILAQKVLYAAYHKLPVAEMSTWQTCQRCMPSDGSWWCFEPSHLEKCDKTNSAFNHSPKQSAPSEPNAVYFARSHRRSASQNHKELKKPVSPDSPECPKPDDGSVDADDLSSGPASPQRDGNEAGAEKTGVSTVGGGSDKSATAIDGDGAEHNTNPSEGASTRPDERHGAKQDKPTSVATVADGGC